MLVQETPTPMTAERLEQLVRQLADARRASGICDTAYDNAEELFKSTHQVTIENRAVARAAVAELEEQVRQGAIDVFQLTDNKKPAPGLEVVQETVVSYDGPKAFTWAVEHKMALQLDEKALTKIALADPKAVQEFVTISKRSKAKIATDLPKALGAAKPAEVAQ